MKRGDEARRNRPQGADGFYLKTMEVIYLLLISGVIFGSLGAACAYLITYKEWEHHYSTPEIPCKMALETAIFTFIFFIVIMVIMGLVIK